MLAKRIIPCLDIKDGRTVKGIQFNSLRDAGDPVELAKLYSAKGADELVFLDITATLEGRKTFIGLVERIAHEISIPFAVGGGIKTVGDALALLGAGADKVTVNTAFIERPELITQIANEIGSQAVVVAIDTAPVDGIWRVFKNAGRTETELDAISWAREVQERGAGEILLTSMAHDGGRTGFALELTRQISETVSIPVIASGGAGMFKDFLDVFVEGKADAALAASVFHYGEMGMFELKEYLRSNGVEVRLENQF